MNSALQLFRGAEVFVFGLGLGDDVVRDVFRARGVVAEFHGELATAVGHGAEVGKFTTLKSTLNTTREVRVEAKGDLAQAQANFATGPTALKLQLGKNILATALDHLGHPERAAD